MRTQLIHLLLCWVSTTDGLTCYVCRDSTTNKNCNKNTATCGTSLNTCMTNVVTGGNSKSITKQCISASSCSAAASSNSAATSSVTCCGSDLCNYSGATTSRLHTLLLALPLCAASALRYLTA